MLLNFKQTIFIFIILASTTGFTQDKPFRGFKDIPFGLSYYEISKKISKYGDSYGNKNRVCLYDYDIGKKKYIITFMLYPENKYYKHSFPLFGLGEKNSKIYDKTIKKWTNILIKKYGKPLKQKNHMKFKYVNNSDSHTTIGYWDNNNIIVELEVSKYYSKHRITKKHTFSNYNGKISVWDKSTYLKHKKEKEQKVKALEEKEHNIINDF